MDWDAVRRKRKSGYFRIHVDCFLFPFIRWDIIGLGRSLLHFEREISVLAELPMGTSSMPNSSVQRVEQPCELAESRPFLYATWSARLPHRMTLHRCAVVLLVTCTKRASYFGGSLAVLHWQPRCPLCLWSGPAPTGTGGLNRRAPIAFLPTGTKMQLKTYVWGI